MTEASTILELQYGHYRSYKEKSSINNSGEPIPWFTYSAIDYLDQLDYSGKTMLEWGSGNSSLFFGQRVKKLFSIEHNEEWFNLVKSHNIQNQELFLADKLRYADYPKKFNQRFDVILIDGIERQSCGSTALDILTDNALIILDNSDRHPDISQIFRNRNLIQVDFHGLGPINNYTWTTSIFLTRGFDFKPLARQPKIPIGGGF